MDTVTIKVELHEGDLEQIRQGNLDFRRAIELVLNDGHPFEIVLVEEYYDE